MPAESIIGEIYMGGMGYAPEGYALCQGQLISIADYDTLFALLGTTFGGDGQQTFGLPDLRGRMPIGWGQGPGLTTRVLAQTGGAEETTLLNSQMPTHTHLLNAVNQAGTVSTPAASLLANTGALDKEYMSTGTTTVPLNFNSIGLAGESQPHNNMPPYLVIHFYIALIGIFPSQ